MRRELCRASCRFARIEGFVASVVGAFALSACYPTLHTPFAEGTEVLAPGKVGLTVVGGGGYAQTNQPGTQPTLGTGFGGLEARVRVGVGAKQELGASFLAAVGTAQSGGDPPFDVGGAITYKIAPVQWFALVADAGVLSVNAASIVTWSGDLAAILAPYTAKDGSQLYTGARGGFAIPMLTNQNAHAVSEAVTVPLGYSLQLSKKTRLIFEAGFVLGFTQLTHELTPVVTDNYTSYGGYGVFGFHYVFN